MNRHAAVRPRTRGAVGQDGNIRGGEVDGQRASNLHLRLIGRAGEGVGTSVSGQIERPHAGGLIPQAVGWRVGNSNSDDSCRERCASHRDPTAEAGRGERWRAGTRAR